MQTQSLEFLLKEDVQLLTEIGFIAAHRGQLQQAHTIFDGLRRIRPNRAFPYIGLAMTCLNAERAHEAVTVLESAVTVIAEERPEIQAFLGLALQLAGRASESKRILQSTAAREENSEGVRLARCMLGYDTTAGVIEDVAKDNHGSRSHWQSH